MNANTMPQSGASLSQLKSELAARGASDFLARHHVPALVARHGLGEVGMQPAAFVTRWIRPGQSLPDDEGADAEVFFVQKKPESPFPDRIGVGRAPNTDIAIRRDGISKYHAYFVPHSDRKYELVDAGSKNGTYVNQTKLVERVPALLQDRCTVRFGTEEFAFLLPRSLLDLLREGTR